MGAVDCEADPGAFLCPCSGNADCNSGYCIPTRDGKACTRTCDDSCPAGWECSLIQFPGADPTFLCLDPGLNLCRPCTSDARCQSGPLGDLADRCVRGEGRAGSFCGVSCAGDGPCTPGYACRSVVALESGQAVTATGVTVGGTEGDPTSRVYVYASASCGGAAVNPAGQIATASVFTVPFTPVDLGCTAVSAKAVDPSGNVSACSNSLTFTHYGCAQCACRAQDWLRTFGTSGDDTGAAAALGDNDNSYEVGATAGPLLGQSAYGGADAYIVKRSSSGVLIWARQLGTALYDAAQAVAVDPAGNVYVAGLTEGDIDGSGVPVATCSGGTSRCSDAWIARFQPDGTRDWLVRFGTDRRESIPDMAWDTKNSRLLVLVSSGATVGGNGLSPQVLAVTPVTGALATLWESVGDDQNKNPGGLHVDASGNIYVQGRAQFKMPGALSTTGSPIASPSSTPITPRSPCATCWRRPASRIT